MLIPFKQQHQKLTLHDANVIIALAEHILRTRHNVHHTTIQVDVEDELSDTCDHDDHLHEIVKLKRHYDEFH